MGSERIDRAAIRGVMSRYGLTSRTEAINLALRLLVPTPLSIDEARALRGIGWSGDLGQMRGDTAT